MAIWGALALAVVAGAVLPLQAGINAELARWVGGAPRAAFLSILIGAVALFAALFVGQALASLAIDHFGWVGFAEHAVSPGRVVGVGLLAAGLVLVRIS
jgi:transporter family-2 protein